MRTLTSLLIALFLFQATAQAAWLRGGWGKRVKLTIDNTDVDATLTHFPVLIDISTSSGRNAEDVSFVFDELTSDANRTKIAVTEDDGTTELYVEIEEWVDASETAWLWVSDSTFSISSSVDTDIYLYYDSTHAANTAQVADLNSRTEVWDSSFTAVYHMKTASPVDVTSNSHDGTGTGNSTATGQIGTANAFDGSGQVDVTWQLTRLEARKQG